MNHYDSLKLLYDNIYNSQLSVKEYWIPSIWINPSEQYGFSNIEPRSFFLSSIEKVYDLSQKLTSDFNKKVHNPLVYNLLLRYTTTFDHNNDGNVSVEKLYGQLLETGTILKSIAILPYLRSLGVDIIYLLPINEIGSFGRKGVLGSPYAYKHPFSIDPRLSEPFLDVPLNEQFKAFVQAAHSLGMKIVLEFVLRTISVDTDLAIEHPNWFYWIKEENLLNGTYQKPSFLNEELIEIKAKVENNDFKDLIPPSDAYIKMFTEPPEKVFKENSRIVGILNNGERVTIPFAFADWPPDDTQPEWTDITYLKYYIHPNYNYIAYNTVRKYSSELIEEGSINQELWLFLENVIPYYIENFNIDGAMIDMGHAIPEALLNSIIFKAKKIKKNFIFWEENFQVTEKSKNIYDATIGYMFFDMENPGKLKTIIKRFSNNEYPLPFFLTAENHNTPRSGRYGKDFNKLVYVFNSFLPGIRFILSGFEWCHDLPYNTGLCFSAEELTLFPPEKLPLFSPIEFKWGYQNILQTIFEVNSIVQRLNITSQPFYEAIIKSIEITNEYIIGYKRIFPNFKLLVFGNFSQSEQKFIFEGLTRSLENSEILLGEFCLTNSDEIILPPWGYLVLLNELSSC